MKRIIDFSSLPWKESVYSVILRTELKACYDRMVLLSQNGETDLSVERLASVGTYDAEEGNHSGSQYDLKEMEKEMLALGSQEENLLKLLIINDGKLPVPAPGSGIAESLLRRCWCTLDPESPLTLNMREDILQHVLSIMNTDLFGKSRELMFRLEAVVYSIVFMYGYANAGLVSQIVLAAAGHTGISIDRKYFIRSLKCYLDYIIDGNGTVFLIHPALKDPVRHIRNGISYMGSEIRIDIQNMAGGMNSCLPSEKNGVESLENFVNRYCRPETDPSELRENIYYMVKQGAGTDEIIRYVQPEMMLSAPQALRAELERIQHTVIPWGTKKNGVIN